VVNLFLLLAALAGTSPGAAERVRRAEPLFDAATVLRGASSSTERVLSVPDRAYGTRDYELVLHWSASTMLAAERSSLSVAIDGRPLTSRWLAGSIDDSGRGRLRIDLGALRPGYHTIEIRARLAVGDDRCAFEHEDDAWLVIEASSELRWTEREVARAVSVRDTPANWFRGPGEDNAVVIDPRLPISTDAATAYLLADQYLRTRGLRPAFGDQAGPRLVLALGEQSGELGPLLAKNADVRAVLDVRGPDLWIVAREAAGLADGLRALESDGSRLCRAARCFVGSTRPADAEPRSAQVDRDPLVVGSLASLGQERGFTAVGPGTHRFRLVWRKPRAWQPTSWPELRFDVAWSAATVLDREHSTVRVELNGRVISTYSLSAAAAGGRLMVRIPEESWDAPEWVFDISARLRPDREVPCEALDVEALWVRFEPTSSLRVPRSEKRYDDGIAGFYSAVEDGAPLRLLWSESLSWRGLARSAPMLVPLAAARPTTDWDWTDDAEQCAPACVAFGPRSGVDVLRRIAVGTGSYWVDAEGVASVPFVSRRDMAAMSVGDCEQPDCRVLRLRWPIADSAQSPEPPELTNLLGALAVFDGDTWHSLLEASTPTGAKKVTGALPPAATDRPLTSEQESLLVKVNWLWGLLVALALVLLVRWLLATARDGARARAGEALAVAQRPTEEHHPG